MSNKLADNVCDALSIDLRQSSSLSSGVSCIVTFQGLDGISKMNRIAENFSSPKNGAIFACNNSNQVNDIDNLIFSRNVPNSATLDNCTCCVIRPHAVKSKNLGKILSIITEQGYEISAITSLYFDRPQSEEFLEVYHGVLPDVSDHVIQLCSGLCVALEIRAEDAVNTFRKTVGPWDVEIAKELRSDSLRGKFGEDKVRSAIHCTDLEVDGVSECEYCFKILS
jgi:nucleoside-diphosphate kinase